MTNATGTQLDLNACAAAIQEAFPSLDRVEPLRPLASGWDSVAVETDGGVIFRFPSRQAVAEAQVKEARLLPYLRGYLTPDIPVPEFQGIASDAFPWGFSGYRRIDGMELRAAAITEQNVDRLARAIAQFLHELHQFPVDRARAVALPGPREWQQGFHSLYQRVSPVLRTRLTITEFGRVRRWWRRFLDSPETWAFQPAVVHNDLSGAHLLVDRQQRELKGVIDWGDVTVGDPAIDFVGLVESYGTDFAWRVLDAYRVMGSTVDAGFLRRVRQLGVVVPFHAVDYALLSAAEEDRRGPDLDEAIAAVRNGALLRAGG